MQVTGSVSLTAWSDPPSLSYLRESIPELACLGASTPPVMGWGVELRGVRDVFCNIDTFAHRDQNRRAQGCRRLKLVVAKGV